MSAVIAAPETIATRRLILRRVSPADAQGAFDAYAADPGVTRFHSWPPAAAVADVERHFVKVSAAWNEGRLFTWTALLGEGGALIGLLDARVDAYMLNISYMIGRRFWNAGYATEAVRALCDWADREPSIARIWAVCALDNPASARVLEKAGLVRGGTLRRWAVLPNISGVPQDCVCYARTKDVTPGRLRRIEGCG
ncbi:MAG TPA: GNAT family N-acetyltransferase [Bacteroidota bacterium]|nr:GNAT family N-acetyltransferase [Bacteroidota bacterium]